jgi:hypothetical protein
VNFTKTGRAQPANVVFQVLLTIKEDKLKDLVLSAFFIGYKAAVQIASGASL